MGRFRASNEAINQLMDREWPEDERQAFLKAMADFAEPAGLHDLRTRKSGTLRFVHSTSGCPPNGRSRRRMTLDRVEEQLQERFPDTELLIHVDPEGQQADRETLAPI